MQYKNIKVMLDGNRTFVTLRCNKPRQDWSEGDGVIVTKILQSPVKYRIKCRILSIVQDYTSMTEKDVLVKLERLDRWACQR